MKAKPHDASTPARTDADSRRALSPLRRWAFRLLALISPLVLLALLEVALRVFGYGYPASFFLKTKIGGESYWVDNPQFARRYFPAGLARSSQPLRVLVRKSPDTVRIFVFGESAAMGDPAPAFGLSRLLDVLLNGRVPGKKFEVVNVAVTAINSHVIREIARDCGSLEGDVWILYLGHNEVVGPFGAGTVFGEQTPSLGVIRANLALKATRVGQLLDAVRERFARGADTPTTWGGMEMFLRQQVRADDPRLARVYEHLENNLEDIFREAQRRDVRVLVCPVVSNLRDCAPFGSAHDPRAAPKLDTWNRLVAEGYALERGTNSTAAGAALVRYVDAGQIDDGHAELHFRRARNYWRLGVFDEARTHFDKARDLDTLRFRADTRINQIIRSTMAQHSSDRLKLFDAEKLFERFSPNRVPGGEFLHEHVHLNFDGNYLLASHLADEIAPLVADPRSLPPPPSPEECARRLALTAWDRHRIQEELVRRVQQPPFTMQLDAAARLADWQSQLAASAAALRGAETNRDQATYQQAVAARPEDWVLRENYAEFLQGAGDFAAAETQWREVLRLLPHSDHAAYSLGNVLDAQGKSAEALGYFRRALSRNPARPEALNGLALALGSLGRTDESIRTFEKAIRKQPGFTEARVNLGQTLTRAGRTNEARAQYLEALRFNSNNAAAHLNYGKLLVDEGRAADALAHYRAAARLNPNSAAAHFNLGNALFAQNSPEAVTHFAEAVRCDPHLAEARDHLGLALAKAGRNAEAMAQWQEAVRLKPTLVNARFNLGVALAKSGRFDEAAAQFRETLRLSPNHAQAADFLRKVEAAKAN